MDKTKFTSEEQTELLKNENVIKVSSKTITYKPDFKLQAVKDNLEKNIDPSTIFRLAGFNLDIVGHTLPKGCLKRWRKIYLEHGPEALLSENRGKNAKGRPRSEEREPYSLEDELRIAQERIHYLEQENEFLKKLEEIERGVVNSTSAKFRLINELYKADKRKFHITDLCKIANVSRSGYYNWVTSESMRTRREKRDHESYLMVSEIFYKKKQKSGWRVIKMELEHKGIIMNHKKIKRLMKKYSLVTKIRQRNPYKQMARATHEHRTFPNILNRQFDQQIPYKTYCTDITYLYYGKGRRAYLSVLLDLASGEVVEYYVSPRITMDLSLGLLSKIVKSRGIHFLEGSLIHSDQGGHYTHPEYSKSLRRMKVTQSMSRKGNCLDNAPVESFFGHMKDELDLWKYRTLEGLTEMIDEYMFEYNNFRFQWTKGKMAPVEYRNHLLSA